MILLLWVAALTAPHGGCVAIEHDRILGADLRIAVPAFDPLPPDADFGPAPIPGNTRVFSVRELKRIAAERHIQSDVSNDACLVWVTKPLFSDALLPEMKKSLGPRTVKIEILDQSSWPVPNGEIAFPRSSLSLGADGIGLWRGYVTYAANRRFSIWVRARISVKENRLVTTEKIAAGHALSFAQFRIEPYDGPLTREEPFTADSQVVGKVAKFDIPGGTLLTRQLIEAPHDVERGETLSVLCQTGHARVEAQCIAEESGRAGDVISVHNARTGRHLRALVQSKGKALVISGDALGLIAEEENQ